MKRILSVLLCVLTAICAVTVSSGAVHAEEAAPVGFARVTLSCFTGETVTRNYAVGDTFTAYTYMNVSQIYEGRVSALSGVQRYNPEVLRLEEAVSKYGVLSDTGGIFPILKQGSCTAKAKESGEIGYNATTPSLDGYLFDTDTSELVVLHYKVIAPGTAAIENSLTWMAQSDERMTRIVTEGEIVNNHFTMPVALSAPEIPLSVYSLSGKVTCFLENTDEVTMELLQNDSVVGRMDGIITDTYYFPEVAAGSYTLRVSKKDHVTRDYAIALAGDLVQDVKIHPLGDITGDGKITNIDYTRAKAHARGGTQLKDYELKVADVIKNDGLVTGVDATRIKSVARGNSTLWDTH